MAQNDVWEISQEWTCGVNSGLLRGHFKENDSHSLDLEQLGLKIVAAAEAHFYNQASQWMPTAAQVVCTTAKMVSNAGSRIFTQYGTGSQDGQASGTPVAAAMAMLVSKYSTVNDKSKRGRLFLPFLSQFFTDGEVIYDSQKVALDGWIEALFNPTSWSITDVGEMKGVIWSPKLKSAIEIANLVLRPVLASQRRRTVHHRSFE